MTDPRNVAHDKKVQQEKKHKGEDLAKGPTANAPQPGKKPHIEKPEPSHDEEESVEPETPDKD